MNIEVNMNEIESVKEIISKVLTENDFNKTEGLVHNKKDSSAKFIFPNGSGNTNFVSLKKSSLKPYTKIMTEEEFYKIARVTKKGLSKKASKYQEFLYSNYKEALKLKDDGYILDILYKALEFKNNLEFVKKLVKDKNFKKEWKKDFGDTSAIEVFKNKGNLKIINIIKARADIIQI